MVWKPGESGNRNGRPKDPMRQEFLAAMREVEKKKKKKLLVHLIEQAFEDNQVLVGVSKKMLPDLTEELNTKENIIIIRPAKDEKKENADIQFKAVSG